MKRTLALITTTVFLFFSENFIAQNNTNNAGEIHGNFQVDAQYYLEDTLIGTTIAQEKMLSNAFSNIVYTRGNITAGFRFESYLNALQSIDPKYKGTGVPYRFVTYTLEDLEITAGNFYEQFGSGLVLRAYEEKGLGIDNCFDGIRLKMNPYRGIYLKGMVGTQRNYFIKAGLVRGFDGEIHLGELRGFHFLTAKVQEAIKFLKFPERKSSTITIQAFGWM